MSDAPGAPPPPRPADAPPPVPAPIPYEGVGASAMEHLIPARNPPALWAYYLGVFGLIPCLGMPLAIAAIVCGVKGLRRVAATPGLPGRTHALVGIVLGSVALLADVGGIVWAVSASR